MMPNVIRTACLRQPDNETDAWPHDTDAPNLTRIEDRRVLRASCCAESVSHDALCQSALQAPHDRVCETVNPFGVPGRRRCHDDRGVHYRALAQQLLVFFQVLHHIGEVLRRCGGAHCPPCGSRTRLDQGTTYVHLEKKLLAHNMLACIDHRIRKYTNVYHRLWTIGHSIATACDLSF